MKKLISGLAILGLLALGVGYYLLQKDNNDVQKEVKKIKVTYQEEGVTPSFVLETGIASDIFKKNGLEIEKNPSLQNVDKIFTSGQTDVVIFGANWLSLYMQNVDMKWIATYSNYRPDYIMSRYSKNDIKSIKKVGIKKLGSPDELNMRLLLKSWSIDPNSVEFVVTAADNVKIDQLKKGNIDIVSIIDKQQAQKLSEDGFNILDTKEELKDYPMGFEIAALDSKLNERPDDFKNFVKAIYEIDQYILNNKQESINVLKDKFKLDDAKAEAYYKDYVSFLKDIKYIPSKESIKNVMDSMIEMISPKNPNRSLDDLVYTKYAEEAVKELGIK
jgi:ABC-type nitrate/sulfonate/bicarbonate transport system substrate-binding protein